MTSRDRAALAELHRALAALDELDRSYRGAAAASDREQALRLTAARLIQDGVIDITWIAQPGPAGGLVIDATAGARTGLLDRLAVPPGAGLTGKAFKVGGVHWVDDYFSSAAITHDFDQQIAAERVHGLISVPIVSGERTLGVLSAGLRRGQAFGDRAIRHVVASAHGAGLALASAERARHAAELAVHEERRRTAVELHDTVGALLYAIGAGLRGLRESDTARADITDRLSTLEQQATQASHLLREALHALHASPSELALWAAVQAECRSLEERTDLRTHVLVLGELPPLDGNRVSVLTRAVREALHNVEKHAHAESVAVTIAADEGYLTIAVTDDGTGFDPDPAQTGIGLASTAESLARLGGTVDVGANPDGGTRWRARLPL